MGCLRFAALIARQVPVALWVSGLRWIGQGLFTGRGSEGLALGESLIGGVVLILAGVAALLPGG